MRSSRRGWPARGRPASAPRCRTGGSAGSPCRGAPPPPPPPPPRPRAPPPPPPRPARRRRPPRRPTHPGRRGACEAPAVRCVVLTSTHERVFSSGGTLTGFAADEPLVLKHFGTDRFPRLFRLIGELGKPTLCAASGHVVAGALGLALACDLIVASEQATFSTPEINGGGFPVMILAPIHRNIGPKKA